MYDVLAGVKVVEVAMWAFVPSGAAVLADWGADVIKVVHPEYGDPMRGAPVGDLPRDKPVAVSFMWEILNRGKRSIGLDLANPASRPVFAALVRDADVFVTNFLPEARAKLGIDIDDIRRHNPDIIYVKGTGHGPRGPDAERRAYDAATWWARGSLADAAMRVSGAEWPTGMVGHGDTISGTVLAGGICAALLQRERTGVAPVVDGSLLGTAIWFNHQPIVASKLGIEWGGGAGNHEQRPPSMNNYRTKDGRFISLVFLNDPDEDWADLCHHLERSELATDARFATTAARRANGPEGVRILDELFAQKTLSEWRNVLATTRGVWGAVQTAGEIHDDPQTIANGFVRQVDYPNGPIALPVPPVLFDEEAGDIARAPDYCEHTDEVLTEIGFNPSEIAKYRSAGVIA